MNNRQIGVWRGSNSPPTNYHIWVKNDTDLYLYDFEKLTWVTFLEMPVLKLELLSSGLVRVSSGDSYYDITTTGTGLDVFKNGNTLVFESNALTTIPTDDILNWDGKTLSHGILAGVEGVYGPSTSTGVNAFAVPKISVDKYGHITKAEQSTITVPAKVVQNPINETGVYPILLAGSPTTDRETGEVNKNANISFEITEDGYGNKTLIIHAPGLDVSGNSTFSGNIVVATGYKIKGDIEGNVSGTATPTDHADTTTKYGAGTSAGENGVQAMYGHVKLLDTLPTNEPAAGYTEEGMGIAASPLMVWNSLQEVNNKFSDDFVKDTDGKFYLNWED